MMFSNRQRKPSSSSKGTTLLELLVVITIILLVTAVAIRTVMPAIESRQIREGARQLNVFINSARNRAMATGRPMGVWIDRMSGLPEASMSVSYAQVPEPYSGDYADSGAEGFLVPDTSSNATYGTRRYVNIVRAGSSTSGGYGLLVSGASTAPFRRSEWSARATAFSSTIAPQPYRLLLDNSQGAAFWAVALGLRTTISTRTRTTTTIVGQPLWRLLLRDQLLQ